MVEPLTGARRARLVELVTGELRSVQLPALRRQDSETTYTRDVLLPVVDDLIFRLGFPGLVRRGSEQGKLRTSHLLRQPFYPDIMVEHFSDPVIAIEVILLQGSHVQNAVATAIGQAIIYGRRYPNRTVLLLADRPGLSADDIADASTWLLGATGIHLVVRQPGVGHLRASMSPHPPTP